MHTSCEPGANVVMPSDSTTLFVLVMKEDLRAEVFNWIALQDLMAVRVCAMAVHEIMMDSTLDLWNLDQYLSLAQVQALGRLTVIRKYKQVSPRCSCEVARVLASLDLNATPSGAVSSQELLGLGLGRRWKLTGLKLEGLRVDDFRLLLGNHPISADILKKLECRITANGLDGLHADHMLADRAFDADWLW